MLRAIPVIDLAAAEAGDSSQLSAVRAATEDLGAVQVVNHRLPVTGRAGTGRAGTGRAGNWLSPGLRPGASSVLRRIRLWMTISPPRARCGTKR